jgi:hypothetical protein
MQSYLLLSLACFVLGCLQAPVASDWKKVSPADQAFTIQFPAEPKQQDRDVKTPAGTVSVKVYYLEPTDGKPGYFLSWSMHGDSPGPPVNLQTRLTRARAAALATTKGKLVSEKKITLSNHPGLDLLIATEKGNFLHTRIYAVENRLYEIFLVGRRDQVTGAQAQRFLLSFRLGAE